MSDPAKLPSGALAGWILLVSALVSFFIMLHHPTLGSPAYETLIDEVLAEAGLNKFVHGSMIILSLLFYYAMSVLSDRLGRQHTSVRLADLSFTFATITMIGAALISGFLTTGVAERFVDGGADADQSFRLLLRLMGETNQVLATAGTLGYGAALLFWSIALTQRDGLTRLIALPGIPVALLMPVGILTGHLHLNLHGMTLVLILLIVWFFLVAIQMIRGRV